MHCYSQSLHFKLEKASAGYRITASAGYRITANLLVTQKVCSHASVKLLQQSDRPFLSRDVGLGAMATTTWQQPRPF